jgi:hypothetical protein
MDGVKLAGLIDVDDVPEDDPFGYLGAHVTAVCHANHVPAQGTLTTRGLTSPFNDDRGIRWELAVDLGWS